MSGLIEEARRDRERLTALRRELHPRAALAVTLKAPGTAGGLQCY